MKSYRYIYTLLLAAGLFLSCKEETQEVSSNETAPENEILISEAQFREKGMDLVQLEEKDFPSIIKTTGRIEVPPENRATINAFVGGYVKRLSLLEGNEVARGDLLLTLENPEYVELQQEYLEVVQQLKYLESDFERQKTMLEENITSQKNFLKAESEYKTSLAKANGLRQKLQMLNIDPTAVEAGTITPEVQIYSPINGKVSQVNVSRGMYISPTQSIMEILNTEHMHMELTVFERDIMRIEEGQEITFTTPEISTEDFQAEVYLVGRSIDQESRTLPVHAHIPDSLVSKFAVGMFVDAQISAEKRIQPALPKGAVLQSSNGSYVLVLKEHSGGNYIFEREPVNAGETRDNFTAIPDSQGLGGRQILFGFDETL